MERGDDSDPIPIDIILDILSRSSDKSIARFRLASKFCASIVSGADFAELFLTKSSTRPPRLLFAINYFAKWRIYSWPQPQNPDDNHSLVVPADFNIKSFGNVAQKNMCSLVSGLLYFPSMRVSREDIGKVPMICNPSTGQYVGLPQLRSKSEPRSLLGYDPIGKQYKVLAISNGEVNVLTLGTGKVAWRKIKCRVNHYHISDGICINGVLYYIANQNSGEKNIVCFDVRYETFRFLNPWYTIWHSLSFGSSPTKLIDYMGKLSAISWLWVLSGRRNVRGVLKLRFWTLVDAQKHKWFEHDFNNVPVNIVVEGDVSVVGATANGEIIMSMDYPSNPFFVFYVNPQKKTLERVGIQGFETRTNHSRVYTFVDYAEDLKFI